MKTAFRKHSIPVFFLVFVAGCGEPAPPQTASQSSPGVDSSPIQVVCTTNIIKDLVRQIGGDRVSVTAIMDGPGIDPHTYTPSPRDTNTLTAADLVVYSGLHLEGQFDEALESLSHRGIPVICVTDGLVRETPDRLIQAEEGVADPHVWFDPDLWAACGNWLASELSAADESGKDQYTSNAENFARSMKETLKSGRDRLADIPKDRRILVTAHDAFEYFARAFDFKVEAVQGISTDSEPGLRRINQLIDLLVEKKISAVFTEQSVSDKNITALVAGCEAKNHTLKIGARLFSDTAGAEGTPEQTLSGALLHNVAKIAEALGTGESADTADETQGATK